jgi:hypothetical protein
MPADLEITKNTTNAEIAKELYGEKAKDYLWSASKDHRDVRGVRNLERNKDKLDGWDIKTEYHARLEVEGGWIDWWYTRNKWMFQGEMFYGRKPNWLTQLIQERLQNDAINNEKPSR